MTATERLRALLDERGVEWKDIGLYQTVTAWESGALIWCAIDKGDHLKVETPTTPEQAVEATLGRGTCRIIEAELDDEGYKLLTIEPYPDATSMDEWYGIMGVCSECGEYVPKMNYCPNCGRKVTD